MMERSATSINTVHLLPSERQSYLQALAAETSHSCVDSLSDGCDAIAESIESEWAATRLWG